MNVPLTRDNAMRPELIGKAEKALNTEVWMTVLSLQMCE